ncbi:MAG: ATP-binding cassette domain-containing protein [Actinobacteria bacterium]|nr:MAG: ATP-binding cassette domain-containing protein [Actinomycetota bacterium]
MSNSIIRVENLVKKFNSFEAVSDVSFEVFEGETFGFLGPNGAGKTTTINALVTIAKPTSGKAYLNGFNVVENPGDVRRSIGIVFQDPSLDERLTAIDNLQFHGIIYNIDKQTRNKNIATMLDMMKLTERQNDLVRTFSGGMKRRLEIARGLIHEPKVLFLDEPTIGLDPQTRNYIWTYIDRLKERTGLTIFLTTHYMDEAENCDRIAIIDEGKIIALDTPENLKKMVGENIITLKTEDNDKAKKEIQDKFGISLKQRADAIRLEVSDGEKFVPKLIKETTVNIDYISLWKPTLDDVFLKLTGRAIREEKADASEQMRQRSRMWIKRR